MIQHPKKIRISRRLLVNSMYIAIVAVSLIATFSPVLNLPSLLDNILQSQKSKRFAEASAYGCSLNSSGNRGPRINDGQYVSRTISGQTVFSISALGISDPDGDSMTIDMALNSKHGQTTIINNGTEVQYTPNANYSGEDGFYVWVIDGHGGRMMQAVKLQVEQRVPTAQADHFYSVGTSSGSYAGPNVVSNDNYSTDITHNSYEVRSLTDGASGTTSVSGFDVTYHTTQPITSVFNDSFTYTTNYQAGASSSNSTGTVGVTIYPYNTVSENQPPQAQLYQVTTTEDQPLILDDMLNHVIDPDSGTLSIVAVNNGGHGTAVLSNDHTIVYTPNPNYNGSDRVYYIISDGQGAHEIGSVYIDVTAVNDDTPVANEDYDILDEGGSIKISDTYEGLMSNDFDPDDGYNSGLTVTNVTTPQHGTIVNNNGNISYQADANYFGPDNFVYTIQDAQGHTVSALAHLVMVHINHNPQATSNNFVVNNVSPSTLSVLTNDSDPDTGDVLSVDTAGGSSYGDITLVNNNTQILYTPNTNGYIGQDYIYYTVRDNNGCTTNTSATIDVQGQPNASPVAINDTTTLNENTIQIINVLANDSDPESDPLTIDSVTQPSHGAVVINSDQTISYTPTQNFVGNDTFTYAISDGNGNTDTASVDIVVNAVNHNPQVQNDTTSTNQDTAVIVDVLANDSDADQGDTLQITSFTNPTHGSVAINVDQTLTYNPSPNYVGSDSFTYTVSDGHGGTSQATVNAQVLHVNHSPVAVDDTESTNEDTSTDIHVLDNDTDPDNDQLTVTQISSIPTTQGTLSINSDQSVHFVPAVNYNGLVTFTYTASDGSLTSQATVRLTVRPVNDNPVANPDTATLTQDTSTQIPVLTNDTDIDGDTLTVQSVTSPSIGQAVINSNGTVSYTPNPNYSGTDSFSYTASDGHGGTAQTTVSLQVLHVNHAPVAVDDNATTNEDAPTDITVLSNDTDQDNDTLTVTQVSQIPASQGSLVINSNQSIHFVPALNYNGPVTFTYTATDGSLTSQATVRLTVSPVNDNPIANPDNATLDEDTTAQIPVLANDTDVDGDTLTVQSVTSPSHGQVIINSNGTVSYSPAINYNGSDSFSYTTSDGHGGTSSALVSVTISPVNDNPVAVNDTAQLNQDTVQNVVVLANDSDPESDPLTIQSLTQPSHGQVVIKSDNTVDYTPGVGYNGTDSFSYTISDGHGGTSTAQVSVTVSRINQAPQAVNDVANTSRDNPILIPVLTNDLDPDGTLNVTTVTIGTQPTKGTIVINPSTGAITYTPISSNFAADGTDTFTYSVKDNDGTTSNPATVTLNVSRSNHPPTIDQQTIQIHKGETKSFDPLQGQDVDGDTPLTFLISNIPSYLDCNQSGTVATGTIIQCTVKPNAPLGPQKIQISPIDSTGLQGAPVDFTLNIQDPLAIQLTLFKDKPTLEVGQTYLIQATVNNPNSFTVKNVTTDLKLKPSELALIANSAQSGSISGQKYSALDSLLSLHAYAQTNTSPTFQYVGNDTLRVIFAQMSANQSQDVVFKVQANVTNPSQIMGTSIIQDSPVNANATITLQATQPFVFPALARTGGVAWLAALGLALAGGFTWLVYNQEKQKKLKLDIDSKNDSKATGINDSSDL